MNDLSFATATDLAAGIRGKEVSSQELTRHFLARIERHNPALNAVVTLNPNAMSDAAAADATIAKGEPGGPLHGVPITIKDTFETKGLRTTAGARDLAEYVPERDAITVSRLLSAGAILLGKTNTPAYAGDLQTYNRLFGTTNNPWDLAHSPGGSSGGAAAALAAGLSCLELGSDIGGSIRTPCSWSGVYGHKPSYGIVPAEGHLSGPPGTTENLDIASYGPIARSAEDLALGLSVLAGPLPREARGYKFQLPPARHTDLRSYRVAAWLDDPAFPTDQALLRVFSDAISALRKEGVLVDEEARPEIPILLAIRTFESLLFSGLSEPLPAKVFDACKVKADALPPTDDSPYGRFARGSVLSHRDWLKTNLQRQAMRAAWERFFTRFDVLLCPATIVPAIPHTQEKGITDRTISVNGASRPYLDLFSWAGVIGVSYLPATAAPVGMTDSGLPAGLQIVSGYLEDATSIDFAARLSRVLGGFSPPPAFRD